MSVELCKKCGDVIFDFGEPHKCLPAWQVWSPDCDETAWGGLRIYAPSAPEAAEEWAEIEDRRTGDYWIVSGEDIEVCVLPLETYESLREDDDPDALATKFRVSGKSVPVYHATEVNSPSDKDE